MIFFKRIISLVLAGVLLFQQIAPSAAQAVPLGRESKVVQPYFLNLSEKFDPVTVRGLSLSSADPMAMDFIVDLGGQSFDKDLLTWTTDGANAGTVFRRKGKFNCTNVCGTLIPKRRNLDLDYVVYALQESATHNKRIDTNGAKIMNNEMAVINIAFPPLKEQTKIANYLDNKTQTIDKIVSNINTQIQTLKELRKTLINDAVTGKIKITKD